MRRMHDTAIPIELEIRRGLLSASCVYSQCVARRHRRHGRQRNICLTATGRTFRFCILQWRESCLTYLHLGGIEKQTKLYSFCRPSLSTLTFECISNRNGEYPCPHDGYAIASIGRAVIQTCTTMRANTKCCRSASACWYYLRALSTRQCYEHANCVSLPALRHWKSNPL